MNKTKIATLIVLVVFMFFVLPMHHAKAAVTVTPATGGFSISADTTDGSYTLLTGPNINEGATADIGTGTIILNAPSGFVFDVGGAAPTVLVTRIGGGGNNNRNINNVASGASLAVTAVTTTQITFTVTDPTSNGVTNSLTWQDVRVRPVSGTPLASGSIVTSGTASLSGVTAGSTNLGTLTQVAGAKSQLVITTQPSAGATVATDFSTKPTIAVRDQFGNTVSTDSASTINHSAVLSTQTCGGTVGSGILSSAPSSGGAVSSGVLIYTAMQYSVSESIKICFTASGVTSALSNTITVSNVPDTIAPAGVSDLALSGATSNSINVSWTAPGDDDNTGTATTYDLRYSTSAIDSDNFSSAITVTGEPTPSIAGSAESVVVTGLSPSTTYYFALKTLDDVANISVISNVQSGATETGEEVSSVAVPSGGTSSARAVYISGQAYPGCVIQVFRKSTTDLTYKQALLRDLIVNADGSFSFSVVGLLFGDYLFGLSVKDKDGNEAGTSSFVAQLSSQDRFVVENFLVQPTIIVREASVTKGADIEISGYSAPESAISIEFDRKIFATTTSGKNGVWKFSTTTGEMSLGNHFVRARQEYKGVVSNYSSEKTVRITTLAIPRADLNGDNMVDIRDWSIFLSRWGSEDAAERRRNDIDGDGVASIVDFSMFLRAMQI